MATPWPQWLTSSFLSANQLEFATNESAFYGPYTQLIYHLFGVEGPFEIAPMFHIPQTRYDSTDVVALFVVQLNKRPVFFIEVKPPASFTLDSKRQQADEQMRERFRDLRPTVVIPRLLGISAFGTRLAFYEYVAATRTLTPPVIIPVSERLDDVAPTDRWNYDILDPDGIARMRQVVQDVIAMCQALGN